MLSLPLSLLLSSILHRTPSLCSYKCIFYVTEELAGAVKLEFIRRTVIYKGGGDLRMYDHCFIYVDICYLYVA